MITKIFANRIKKDFFRLAIFSLIVVIVWLVMTTYRALNISNTSPDVKKQLLPLTTSLPLDTMEQINSRLESPEIDWSSLNLTGPVIVTEPVTATASVQGT